MAKNKPPKRRTGYYGKRMVKCETCRLPRPYGEECPRCDGIDMDERPGLSGSPVRTEHWGYGRINEK